MRTITLTAILAAGSLTSSIHAAPQSGNLVQEVQSTYVPNVLDASGIKVAQAGAILAVQVDGVQGAPRGKLSQPFANVFESGQIKASGGLLKNRFSTPLNAARVFAVGEKVYLLKTEVKDSAIVFVVQSCGTCNPKVVDPGHVPYRAEVTFKFIKNALASTDFKSVQGVIDQVFKFADADTDTASAAGGAPAAPAASGNSPRPDPPAPPPAQAEATPKFDPIPPPPPPPAAPKKIALGQSADEVKANLGDPEQIIELGDKTIYKYKDLKVTFLKGKLTSVE